MEYDFTHCRSDKHGFAGMAFSIESCIFEFGCVRPCDQLLDEPSGRVAANVIQLHYDLGSTVSHACLQSLLPLKADAVAAYL